MYDNGVQVSEYEGKPFLVDLVDMMESRLTPEGISAWKKKEEKRELEEEAKHVRKAERRRLRALEEAARNATTTQPLKS